MPSLQRLLVVHLALSATGCGLFYKHSHGTRSFTVYSDRDELFLQQIAPRIETIYAGLQRCFDVSPEQLGTASICLEGEETGVVDLHHTPDILGFYLPWFNVISIGAWPVSQGRDALNQVLIHEVAHHFITTAWPSTSAECWFNEGLAGALEMSLLGEGHFEVQTLNPVLFQVAQQTLLSSDTPVSLSEVLNLSWSQFHDDATKESNYALAWSFVYFVLERHLPTTLPLKQRIQQLQALDRSDLARLEPGWKHFLRGFNLGGVLLELAARQEPHARLTSLWSLRQLGQLRLQNDPDIFAGLVKLFTANNPLIRQGAFLAFASRLGFTSHSFVLESAVVRQGIRQLRELVLDRSTPSELRAALAESFGANRRTRDDWLGPLVALLDDEDGSARAAAAMALSELGTKPTVVNPAFWRGGSATERACEVTEWRDWLVTASPALATFR